MNAISFQIQQLCKELYQTVSFCLFLIIFSISFIETEKVVLFYNMLSTYAKKDKERERER